MSVILEELWLTTLGVGVCKPGPGAGLLNVKGGFCGGVEVCAFSDVDV